MQSDNTPKLKNDNFLRALRGEKVDRVPVWIMRQAGRYLPEFNKVRSNHSFFEVCTDKDLAAEVTIQPLDRFDLDAAILFCDILVIPQALGMHCDIIKGVGPVFSDKLESPDDMRSRIVRRDDTLSQLDYVSEAIGEILKRLDGRVPLIGFSGAPWTLMCYMIEGKSSKTWSEAITWLYKYPEDSKHLLNILGDLVADYLIKQIEAGVHAVQLFESWGGVLSQKLFREIMLPCLVNIGKKVKKETNNKVPIILFAKGVHYALEEISSSGAFDCISLDCTMDPVQSRKISGDNITLQGNLDPCALFDTKENIKEHVREMLNQFGTHRYVANLGHGLMPNHDPEHVGAFIDAVHEISKEMIEKDNQ